DTIHSPYFVNCMHISMVLGDMLGSAKLNGIAGHTSNYGDRFVLDKGARSSLEKGAKAQYYPLSPPDNKKYNQSRPTYHLDNLLTRTEKHYWATINKLNASTSKCACAIITKETGISCMPLAAASSAFIHSSFFPIDPFHLLCQNIVAFV
ncbi:hypothetical protein SERLA73DRAFT_43798, partial [Serpula lacrymans var. lacrymans S7.3]